MLIPRSAVLYDAFGQASCFAGESNADEFHRIRIELGTAHQKDVVVLRGLDKDDIVVSSGAQRLSAEESKDDLAVEDDD